MLYIIIIMLLIYSVMHVIGSFDRCEVCHNAEELLKRAVNWSKEEAEIIKTYRRRHILQQFEERIKLQDNIASTYELDSNQRPLTALLLPDGMTTVTGDTPRIGDRRSKSDNKVITSRIIGVEVHCGPVHGTMLYYTDNLTSGGANIMIEVIRQGNIYEVPFIFQLDRSNFVWLCVLYVSNFGFKNSAGKEER
jgi:hypothetical protein